MRQQKPFQLRDFARLPKNQKQACYMLAGCTFFLILVITATTLILHTAKDTGNTQSNPSLADSQYDKGAGELDEQALGKTVLAQTEDAGQAYLNATVFAGDSNTVRMWGYGLVALDGFVGMEGMSIEGVPYEACVYFENDWNAYTIPQGIAQMQPQRVIMMFGTNNAGGSISTGAFISTYKKSIQAIQTAYPYCDIIISAIPPVAAQRDYKNITMQTIDAFNRALAEMAKELGLPFLNTSEVLKDRSGFAKPEYMDADGLHFNEAGVRAVLQYVRTHAYEAPDRRPGERSVPARRPAPVPEPESSSQILPEPEEEPSSSSNVSAPSVPQPPESQPQSDASIPQPEAPDSQPEPAQSQTPPSSDLPPSDATVQPPDTTVAPDTSAGDLIAE